MVVQARRASAWLADMRRAEWPQCLAPWSLSQNADVAQADPSKEGGLFGQENAKWVFHNSNFGIELWSSC